VGPSLCLTQLTCTITDVLLLELSAASMSSQTAYTKNFLYLFRLIRNDLKI